MFERRNERKQATADTAIGIEDQHLQRGRLRSPFR